MRLKVLCVQPAPEQLHVPKPQSEFNAHNFQCKLTNHAITVNSSDYY